MLIFRACPVKFSEGWKPRKLKQNMSNKDQPSHIESAERIVHTYAKESLVNDEASVGEEAPIMMLEDEHFNANEIREAIEEVFQDQQ